jgi:hypothetical protein
MSSAHQATQADSTQYDQVDAPAWVERELAGCELKDRRLIRRFRTLLSHLASSPGESIPFACQDWANTKAAYRFLDNANVNEADILAGHFRATRDRAASTSGPVLVLHDTTEFSFKRKDVDAIGRTKITFAGNDRDGRPRLRTVCGILMHSSLAITTEGLPLGLAAIKFWSREKFKGSKALRNKVNFTRIPIEAKESVRWLENLKQASAQIDDPARCVHIGDRESDIYELFCAAIEFGTHFLFRTCVDRLAGDGGHTVSTVMDEVRCKGLHRVEVADRDGTSAIAVLELRYQRIRILPPIGKQNRYPSLELTVLHATERHPPTGRDRIEWKLITDLPITSRAEAIEKLQWYALRWRIETFHKILKSGLRAEELQLRTAQRIVNLLGVFCIIGWRIFWMTMLRRVTRCSPPTLAFTPVEIELLSRTAARSRGHAREQCQSLEGCLLQLARLGGYLNRASDGPPGNTVMWRGMSRLTDIALGYELAGGECG